MSEATIRDYLAENLNMIEDGLTLCSKEFHLQNIHGAAGFIDIFAKDAKDNLVIIEIKKTDAAARQAITELSKYAALLKMSRSIKNSEFRLIVISSSWHELLVPYSEFFHATNYDISAFEVKIDSKDTPTSISSIDALPDIETRNICRRHFIWEFNDVILATRAISIYREFFQQIGIQDFLLCLVEVSPPIDGVKWMVYFAQQRKSKDFYFSIIKKRFDQNRADEIIGYIENFTDEDDQIDEAADQCTDSSPNTSSIGCQISYPERFNKWNTSAYWKNMSIYRHGIFENDPRLTDELLIEDLSGFTGSSNVHFLSVFSTQNKAKFSEVTHEIEESLYFNDSWRHAIQDILKYAQRITATNVTIQIFSPSDIIETIWAATVNSPNSYVPSFVVLIPRADNQTLEAFTGRVGWDGSSTSLAEIFDEFYEGKESKYFLKRHFGEQRKHNTDILQSIGMSYRVDFTEYSETGEKSKTNVGIRNKDVFEKKEKYTKSIFDFLSEKTNLQKEILNMFSRRQIARGIFSIGEE